MQDMDKENILNMQKSSALFLDTNPTSLHMHACMLAKTSVALQRGNKKIVATYMG
jgi:hypothetical protein